MSRDQVVPGGADAEELDSVLLEAHRLVYGPRQGTYGHPADDYACVGRVFAAYLQKWLRDHHGIDAQIPDLPPWLCVLMMAGGVKASRAIKTPEMRDNWTDGAGYHECGWRCVNRPDGEEG